ncbi:MAG: DUF4347 domain-containing protein, partial [Lentisphaeraceae bacterium]|nr:DUF4347 domain-containing protein [Lentisphaeraceae bacterium]
MTTKPIFEQLEARVLLSATPFQENSNDAVISAAAEQNEQAAATQNQVSEILFIDENVENYQEILDGLERNVEVHVLDADKNGISQISEILDGRTDIDAVHILSHGDAGQINLGNTALTSSNIDSYAEQIKAWSSSFSENADILLYGCNVGQDGDFMASLAQYSGADIAASNDLTGVGGDADLEVDQGLIEADTIIAQSVLESASVTLAAEPTVNALDTSFTQPIITGTATLADGESLTVEVAGTTYTVDDGNLTHDTVANTWKLVIPTALAIDGRYDVTAVITATDGSKTSDISSGELLIAAPKVGTYTNSATPTITGRAVLGDGDILTVNGDSIDYTVGDGNLTHDLVTDTWTLVIPVAITPNATYDVTVTVSNDSQSMSDHTSG